MSAEKMYPSYEMMPTWELWSKALNIEYRQCIDEGKDIVGYRDLFTAVEKMSPTEEKERKCDELFELIQSIGNRNDYPYDEPNACFKTLRVYDIIYKGRLNNES